MIELIIVWLTTHIGEVTGLVTALLLLIEKIKAIPWRPITKVLKFIGKILQKIGRALNADIYEKVDAMDKKLTENLALNEEQHKHIKQLLEEYHCKLEKLKQDIDENEKDRIRQIIYHYGAIARKCGEISIEEFRYIQDIYYKYSGPLNGNGKVSEEYELISEYFNKCKIR